MRYRPGITEKRLNNKRFARIEWAILEAYFDGELCVSARTMADKVGVARSTIYNHHKTVREIIPDYERYILRKYKRMIRKALKGRGVRIKSLYAKALFFMLQNKRVFVVLARGGDRRVVEQMVMELRGRIEVVMRLPKNSNSLYNVYVDEVVGLILRWNADGLREAEMDELLVNIMHLTETMRQRLRFLLD